MRILFRSLPYVAALSLSGICAQANVEEPLLTLSIESYEAFTNDVTEVAANVGQDGITATIPMMLGVEVMKLVDPSKPWHAAVWMDSFMAPPIAAIIVPIEDFAAFEAAVQMSMIGQMGATYLDAGDNVILLTSNPGFPVPEGWSDIAASYAAGLSIETSDTIELNLALSDDLRIMAIAGMENSMNEANAVFEQPGVATASGMSSEQMASIFDGYFTFMKSMVSDTDRIGLGLSVNESAFDFSVEVAPLDGTGLAEFVRSQDVELLDLEEVVDWEDDMTMIMSMSDLPESWMPLLRSFMQGVMPFYGADQSAADELVDVITATLPFKGAYSMSFDGGFAFSGFYEILEGKASEVYESWLKASKLMASNQDGVDPYYSEINVVRASRSIGGHEIDRLEMKLNMDHPTLKMPEQKAAMEQFFVGGQIVYEMALVDNRIYMATEGALNFDKVKAVGSSPMAISPDTRVIFAMDIARMIAMGASASPEPMPFSMDALEGLDAKITYAIEMNESIVLKSGFPLSLIEFFVSEAQD